MRLKLKHVSLLTLRLKVLNNSNSLQLAYLATNNGFDEVLMIIGKMDKNCEYLVFYKEALQSFFVI